MPADATPTTPVQDQLTAIDLVRTNINWLDGIVEYSLRLTWQGGNVTERRGIVKASDFLSYAAAWMQATPKRKQLQWFVANSYETNLTIA